MGNKTNTLFSVFCFATLLGCVSIKQGIEGQVQWVSGNQMPGPDKKPAPTQGIEREIYIYELLSLDDVESKDGFISRVNKPLIKIVQSNPEGNFLVHLDPGTYSILIKEPQGLFANRFDQQNHIHPITVKKHEMVKITVVVDYEAAY